MLSTIGVIQLPEFNPDIFHWRFITIRWYGVAYIAAFVLGYAGLKFMMRRGLLRMKSEELVDLVGWLALGVIIGGRLGWWMFYHRASGPEPWYAPIAIWLGGMSFHGGLIGVTVAMLLYARNRNIPFWNVADAMAVVTPIGLFLGRIANFINAELVGRPTDVPWAVVYHGETAARHPSQLYEAALEGPILLGLLLLALWWNRKLDGLLSPVFLMGYGVVRFAVEFTREPDSQLGFIAMGWLTMGQLLSALLVVAGLILLWRWARAKAPA